MTCLYVFFLALMVSFLGSIPPGSINISTLQYALSGKKKAALTFALAASFVEFFYAGIAVRFQIFLLETPSVADWFKVITACVLVFLGILNLFKKDKEEQKEPKKENRSALLKGIVLALTNPLAIPFWLVVTSYLTTVGWVILDDRNYLFYITGVSTGTFLLLLLVTYLGARYSSIQHNTFLIYKVPGATFILMGIWTYVKA